MWVHLLGKFCRICGKPMTLLDEKPQRWYCYKDDQAFLAGDDRWVGEFETGKPYAATREEIEESARVDLYGLPPQGCLASFPGLAGIVPTDCFWRNRAGSKEMPRFLKQKGQLLPGTIHVTKGKILCRAKLSFTSTFRVMLVPVIKSDIGSGTYAVDCDLAHDTKVVLAPLASGPADAQAALIQPLFESYKAHSTTPTCSLQVLTVHSKPILETRLYQWGDHISGTLLDDSDLSRLKEAVEKARPSAKESSESELAYCTNCGAKIGPAKFCVHCGVPQVSA